MLSGTPFTPHFVLTGSRPRHNVLLLLILDYRKLQHLIHRGVDDKSRINTHGGI